MIFLRFFLFYFATSIPNPFFGNYKVVKELMVPSLPPTFIHSVGMNCQNLTIKREKRQITRNTQHKTKKQENKNVIPAKAGIP